MDLCYEWKCFQTTSVVPFPSVISIASQVCFSLGALITPAGSAFSFSSTIPLPMRCQVPLGSVMSPRLLYWCGFQTTCFYEYDFSFCLCFLTFPYSVHLVFLSSSFSESAFSYDIVLLFMFQFMDLIFNLRICFLVFEYGHVLWSYRFFRHMILELVMFSGWAFCHVLQYTTFHGMS